MPIGYRSFVLRAPCQNVINNRGKNHYIICSLNCTSCLALVISGDTAISNYSYNSTSTTAVVSS